MFLAAACWMKLPHIATLHQQLLTYLPLGTPPSFAVDFGLRPVCACHKSFILWLWLNMRIHKLPNSRTVGIWKWLLTLSSVCEKQTTQNTFGNIHLIKTSTGFHGCKQWLVSYTTIDWETLVKNMSQAFCINSLFTDINFNQTLNIPVVVNKADDNNNCFSLPGTLVKNERKISRRMSFGLPLPSEWVEYTASSWCYELIDIHVSQVGVKVCPPYRQ